MMRVIGVLVLFASIEAAGAAGGGEDPALTEAENVRVREVPRVSVESQGSVFDGFLLRTGPTEPLLLLCPDGRWVDVERKNSAVTPLGDAPLASVPSTPLVIGLGFGSKLLADQCEEWLRDQGEVAWAALFEGTRHSSVEVRRRCWRVLSRTNVVDAACLAAAKRSLDDEDEVVRKYALACWCRQPSVDVVGGCSSALLFDRSMLVQHEALVQLGLSGDLRGMDPILDFLVVSRDRSLRRVGHRSLRKLTGLNLGTDASAWRAWWENRRERLLEEQASSR